MRTELGFLPTASPEMNPTELLWRRGKDHVSANRVYPTVQEQADVLVNHPLSTSNPQVLPTTGCLSANFWLSS